MCVWNGVLFAFSLEKRSPPLASSGTAPFAIGWQMNGYGDFFDIFFDHGNLKQTDKNSRVTKKKEMMLNFHSQIFLTEEGLRVLQWARA